MSNVIRVESRMKKELKKLSLAWLALSLTCGGLWSISDMSVKLILNITCNKSHTLP